MVKEPPSEQGLLDAAFSMIEERLPPRWGLEWMEYGSDEGRDRLLYVKNPSTSSKGFVVQAKRSLTPRDVVATFTPELVQRLRVVSGNTPILVVAPFISPRSQDLLTAQGLSYVDLTGNVRLVLDHPGLFVRTTGAARSPYSVPRPTRGVRGAKAGRIVRALIDARPPYTVSRIAEVAGVVPGYVSRVLETLESEALVVRGARGQVVDVEWQELIRRRAAALDLLASDTTKTYVSPHGAARLLDEVRRVHHAVVVTGSFAAARLSQVTAPSLLVMYCMRHEDFASGLRLRRVAEGADVALVVPESPSILRGAIERDGVSWAAPSQVAIDCLTGPGRMPSEGEAVIEWMADHEDAWRADTIADLAPPPDWARA